MIVGHARIFAQAVVINLARVIKKQVSLKRHHINHEVHMLNAKEALKLSLKGDPERMVLIAETKIKEAIKNHNEKCLLKFSKHLYGDTDIRLLTDTLRGSGYFCMPLILKKGDYHELEVGW